jgi:hypothetical protein
MVPRSWPRFRLLPPIGESRQTERRFNQKQVFALHDPKGTFFLLAPKRNDDDECFFVVIFLVLSFLSLFLKKRSI